MGGGLSLDSLTFSSLLLYSVFSLVLLQIGKLALRGCDLSAAHNFSAMMVAQFSCNNKRKRHCLVKQIQPRKQFG